MKLDLGCAVEWVSCITNVKLTSSNPERKCIQNSGLAHLEGKLSIDFDTLEDW